MDDANGSGFGEYITKDSGERAQFQTGAQRDTAKGKGRYDLLPVLALRRLAQLYERGAIKYEARNWEKGIPVSRMYDSGIRHALQALAGLRDEDHLAGAVFNLLGIMEYEERRKLGMAGYRELFEEMGPLYETNQPITATEIRELMEQSQKQVREGMNEALREVVQFNRGEVHPMLKPEAVVELAKQAEEQGAATWEKMGDRREPPAEAEDKPLPGMSAFGVHPELHAPTEEEKDDLFRDEEKPAHRFPVHPWLYRSR